MSLDTPLCTESVTGQATVFHGSVLGNEAFLALVVDDNDDNLLLMQYALEMLGVAFVAATSGDEALQLADQHLFSLIFLDIVMSGKSGISVAQILRQQRCYSKTPIIAVTALAFPKDRLRLLAAGFSDCLIKPYLLRELDVLVGKYRPVQHQH